MEQRSSITGARSLGAICHRRVEEAQLSRRLLVYGSDMNRRLAILNFSFLKPECRTADD